MRSGVEAVFQDILGSLANQKHFNWIVPHTSVLQGVRIIQHGWWWPLQPPMHGSDLDLHSLDFDTSFQKGHLDPGLDLKLADFHEHL